MSDDLQTGLLTAYLVAADDMPGKFECIPRFMVLGGAPVMPIALVDQHGFIDSVLNEFLQEPPFLPCDDQQALRHQSVDRWSEVIYRRFLACITENMKGTPTGCDPAIEPMARDIGVSTMQIRFGDFSRGVGGDAELSSSCRHGYLDTTRSAYWNRGA